MKLNKTFGKIPYNILWNIPFRCVTVVPELCKSVTPPPGKSTFSESTRMLFSNISLIMLLHKQFFPIQGKGTIVNNSYIVTYVNKQTTKNNIFIKEILIVASSELLPKYTGTHNHLITHFQRTPWNIYHIWNRSDTPQFRELCVSDTFWKPVRTYVDYCLLGCDAM